MKLSIIIPVYNEQEIIKQQLARLKEVCPADVEVLIIDGDSQDNTLAIAKKYFDKVVSSQQGRAYQMNAGASKAKGDIFLFLHIDTQLPQTFMTELQSLDPDSYDWGRFDIRFNSERFIFKIIAMMMNIRSRITGVCTGDQAIFMTRKAYEKVNGFAEIDLMEDVAICKELRKLRSPICINAKAVTSNRRWQEKGVIKTIFLMWFLRLAYFLQISPNKLGKLYG